MKSAFIILALVTLAGCGSMGMQSGSTSSGSTSTSASSGSMAAPSSSMYGTDPSYSPERKIAELVAPTMFLP